MKEKGNLICQDQCRIAFSRIFSSALASAVYKGTTHGASTTVFNYIS